MVAAAHWAIHMTSTRGHGTTVRARVPIARDNNAIFSPLV